jgi:hypothetical protein
MNNPRAIGADQTITNISGNDYTAAVQVSTKACQLFSLDAGPGTAAADTYLWLYDTAAGTTSSAGPKIVQIVKSGNSLHVEWSQGIPFSNGLYIGIATDAPTAANDTRTAAAANVMSVAAGIRIVASA